MTAMGWLFLIISWGVITGLCVFCFYRIFQLERGEVVAPIEIEAELEEAEDRGERIHPATDANES